VFGVVDSDIGDIFRLSLRCSFVLDSLFLCAIKIFGVVQRSS